MDVIYFISDLYIFNEISHLLKIIVKKSKLFEVKKFSKIVGSYLENALSSLECVNIV